MTTAIDIITDALMEIGVAEAGQSIQPGDAAFALRKLNQRLELWGNSRLTFPILAQYTVTLTGAASYTLGPATTPTALDRPLKLVRCTAVDSGGLSHDVAVLTKQQWDGITNKAIDGGAPDSVWYEAALTNGVLYVYPRSTGYTLQIDALALLARFATVLSDVDLPPGASTCLALALADDMATSYGKPCPPDLRRRAAGALHAYKRTNYETVYVDGPRNTEYQIERGW